MDNFKIIGISLVIFGILLEMIFKFRDSQKKDAEKKAKQSLKKDK